MSNYAVRAALAIAVAAAATQSSFALDHGPTPAQAGVFKQLREQWARSLHDKRIDASVAEYTADAEFIQPDGARVHGTEAIHKLYETITATFDSDLVFDSQRVETSWNLAYDSGTYRETLIVRATGKHLQSTGSYLTEYRRGKDGGWLIVEQVWTGSVQ